LFRGKGDLCFFYAFNIGNMSVGKTVQQSLPLAAVTAGILFVLALIMGLTAKKKT